MQNEDAGKSVHRPSAEIVAARLHYRQEMDELDAVIRSSPHYQKDAFTRARAEFYIEQVKAVAFNLGISPQPHYPRFLVDTLFGPNLYPIWGPNPDFKYAWTWLDGSKTYRIWGKRNDTARAGFQVTSEFWGDPKERSLGDFTLDTMQVESDGSYQITVSAHKQPGNWIPLDGNTENNFIFLRRTLVDWEKEEVATAFIELVDAPSVSINLDDGQLAARIGRAGTMLKESTSRYTLGQITMMIDKVGYNAFYCVVGSENQDGGYNPGANYFCNLFQIERDQALLIEIELTNPKYWGIHVTDIWLQSLDFVNHQASLNAAQTAVDSDGVMRFVLSVTDPGVPNWLDTVDATYGLVQFRSYYAESRPKVSSRVVQLDQIRDHLPAHTRKVLPAERQDTMRLRARAILRHYST